MHGHLTLFFTELCLLQTKKRTDSKKQNKIKMSLEILSGPGNEKCTLISP